MLDPHSYDTPKRRTSTELLVKCTRRLRRAPVVIAPAKVPTCPQFAQPPPAIFCNRLYDASNFANQRRSSSCGSALSCGIGVECPDVLSRCLSFSKSRTPAVSNGSRPAHIWAENAFDSFRPATRPFAGRSRRRRRSDPVSAVFDRIKRAANGYAYPQRRPIARLS